LLDALFMLKQNLLTFVSRLLVGAAWVKDRHGVVQFYREKIKAEAEGRAYVPPPPSKVTMATAAKTTGMTRNSRSFGNSGWDDWGDEGGRPAKVGLHIHSLC
jgi:hypothetical protein